MRVRELALEGVREALHRDRLTCAAGASSPASTWPTIRSYAARLTAIGTVRLPWLRMLRP